MDYYPTTVCQDIGVCGYMSLYIYVDATEGMQHLCYCEKGHTPDLDEILGNSQGTVKTSMDHPTQGKTQM